MAPMAKCVAKTLPALVRLERSGHSVQRVKNYWPADDNYSGINSILKAPDGLEWDAVNLATLRAL